MIFVTSDWHLSHDREFIWKTRGYNSVEEMNYDLIKKHNSIVTKNDDVYVLGDCCLGGKNALEQNYQLMQQFNGKLHIVLGNHCTPTRQKMYEKLSNVVEISWAIRLDYKKHHFLMTHWPCMTGNLEQESLKQGILNLFGHTHQNDNFFNEMPFMYHVGVDSHNGKPVLLDNIIEEMYKKVKECKMYL